MIKLFPYTKTAINKYNVIKWVKKEIKDFLIYYERGEKHVLADDSLKMKVYFFNSIYKNLGYGNYLLYNVYKLCNHNLNKKISELSIVTNLEHPTYHAVNEINPNIFNLKETEKDYIKARTLYNELTSNLSYDELPLSTLNEIFDFYVSQNLNFEFGASSYDLYKFLPNNFVRIPIVNVEKVVYPVYSKVYNKTFGLDPLIITEWDKDIELPSGNIIIHANSIKEYQEKGLLTYEVKEKTLEKAIKYNLTYIYEHRN